MFNFLKTTLFGGVVFLIPIVVLVAVVGNGLKFMDKLATPLLKLIPVEGFAGALFVHLLPLIFLLIVCFLAGLIAKTPVVGRWVRTFESEVLLKLPPYALMKAKTGSILNPDVTDKLTPVIIGFDDSQQFAYEVERTRAGDVVIFLPGAPDAWSGSVCIVESNRVTPLDSNVKTIGSCMKRLGKGSADILGKSAS